MTVYSKDHWFISINIDDLSASRLQKNYDPLSQIEQLLESLNVFNKGSSKEYGAVWEMNNNKDVFCVYFR